MYYIIAALVAFAAAAILQRLVREYRAPHDSYSRHADESVLS